MTTPTALSASGKQETITQEAALTMAGQSISSVDANIIDSVKEAVRWKEQCYLARIFPEINNKWSKKHKKPWRYVTSVTAGDSSTTADFLNKLHMAEGNVDFVNLSTFERSKLLWDLKVSKVLYDATEADGGEKVYTYRKEIDLVFEKMAAEDMDKYRAKQGVDHHKVGANKQVYLGRPQTGYGIKSFSWSLVGSNPETVRNDIQASLVLQFQSFDQLSAVRTDNEGDEYSLLDLLGYGPTSPKNKEGSTDDYDPALFEIKVEAGWGVHQEDTALSKKIAGQRTVLFLTLIDHDFSISQVGTFTLSLTYRARLESLASQYRANIVFNPQSQEYLELKDLDVQIANANEECNQQLYNSYKADRKKLLRAAWLESFQSIFQTEFRSDNFKSDTINSRKRQDEQVDSKREAKLTGTEVPFDSDKWRIYETNSYVGTIYEWVNGTLPPSTGLIDEVSPMTGITGVSAIDAVLAGNTGAVPTDFTKRTLNIIDDNDGDPLYKLRFIFLGDLLEVMASRAFNKKYFLATKVVAGAFGTADMIKIISGPVRLGIDGVGEIQCSLSDIPIAVEEFADFWYENVVSKGKEVYNLMDFIRDLGDQLLNKAFGEGCTEGTGKSIGGSTQIKTGFVSLPQASDGTDPLLNLPADVYDPVTGDIKVENIPTLVNPELLSSTPADKFYNYVVLYVENDNTMEKFSGDEIKDGKNGVYHLKIHDGILQSIDFQKTDQPYLRESRFFQFNENPLVHLSNRYNIRATTVGNTIFYPGDTIYIDPIGFGTSLGDPMKSESLSNVMGLGGYHTIQSVENSISRDFTTEIVALWTSNGTTSARSRYTDQKCVDYGDSE
tara:strand:- start:2810 stop:5323 length:2514 start_codon:yes stop_codon:yes gene_type:complete